MTIVDANQLAKSITRNSSWQTYITIQLLVDKNLKADCFKAYAYFRWLDDQIDLYCSTKTDRLRCIKRQQELIAASYKQKLVEIDASEEQLIVELIASDTKKNSKLQSFIQNFFAVIAFDAERKDSYINQQQLAWYKLTLATAVTDGIEHFINHDYKYPSHPTQYQAAIGAHTVHMLRDYQEDLQEGYINIPKEYLNTCRMKLEQIDCPDFGEWVKEQLSQAQTHFQVGRTYIRQLKVLRGKLAASWYCARFETLCQEISSDGYQLKPKYTRQRQLKKYMWMFWIAIKVVNLHYFDLVMGKLK